MTDLAARAIFPLALAAAVALLLRGYADVGDGFSAGAVAGAGAALQFAALPFDRAVARTRAVLAPRMIALGLLLTLLTAWWPVLFGLPPVSHFPAPEAHAAAFGVLEFHTGVLFDLGVAAAVYGAVTGAFGRLNAPATGRDDPGDAP